MKIRVAIAFIVLGTYSHAQTWQSISRASTYQTIPVDQFIINPYTNDLWFVGKTPGWNNQLAVIESDGDVEVFPQDSGTGFLWGADLCMAFTPEHVYYAHDNYGLYSFDGYISQMKFNFSGNTDRFTEISSNLDTIHVCFDPPGLDFNYAYILYTELSSAYTNHFAKRIIAKNTFKYSVYSINTDLIYFTGSDNGDHTYIIGDPFGNNDPDYLGGYYNDLKFTRLTDTLCIGTKLGISKVYAYDVFDSITTNNTTNMPSPNVLEMEWDLEDNLWAVFGTAGDTAFAIAMLENETWVSRFDAGNSPINFDEFLGLEIDTLGNLWVADHDHVHTFLTSNSPDWLGNYELQHSTVFSVFPNPSSGTFSIRTSEDVHPTTIELMDLSGRTVATYEYQPTIHTNLPSGSYFLQLKNGNAVLGVEKVMVE